MDPYGGTSLGGVKGGSAETGGQRQHLASRDRDVARVRVRRIEVAEEGCCPRTLGPSLGRKAGPNQTEAG